jgi:hypothetical protein
VSPVKAVGYVQSGREGGREGGAEGGAEDVGDKAKLANT